MKEISIETLVSIYNQMDAQIATEQKSALLSLNFPLFKELEGGRKSIHAFVESAILSSADCKQQ